MTTSASQRCISLRRRRGGARSAVGLSAAALLIAFALGCGRLPAPPGAEVLTPVPVDTSTVTTVPPSPAAAGTQAAPSEAIAHFSRGKSWWITSIRMVDVTTGWAIAGQSQAGDHVMRTRDGGHTWQDVTPPEPAPTEAEGSKVATAFFLDSDTAWVTYSFSAQFAWFSSPTVWKTSNGGRSWEGAPLAVNDLQDKFYSDFYVVDSLHFADAWTGWLLIDLDPRPYPASDDVALFKTVDGGMQWQRVIDPSTGGDIQKGCGKTEMTFVDELNGWMGEDCGYQQAGLFIHWSDDGGLTWNLLELPPPAAETELFGHAWCRTESPTLFSPQSGLVAAQCRDTRDGRELHYLYSTASAGQTWRPYPFPGGSLHFTSPDVGWALGDAIHQTQDGGQTWLTVNSMDWYGDVFSFVNEEVAWAVARSGQALFLAQTTDGGRTWEQLEPQLVMAEQATTPVPLPTAAWIDMPRLRPGQPITLSSISMISPDAGWGTSGWHVLVTGDGAITWQEVTPPEPALLEASAGEQVIGAFLDERTAWLVFVDRQQPPESIRVWITRDAGESWAASPGMFPAGGEFFDVFLRVQGPNTAWLLTDTIVMGTGRNDLYTLYHTLDGGASWRETRMIPYVVTDIEFASGAVGWMTEEKTGPYAEPVEPFIEVSLDGGASWDTLNLPPPSQDPGLFERYDFCSTYDATFFAPVSGLVAMECFHEETAKVANFASYLYRTSDGGATWEASRLPLSVRAGSVLLFSSETRGLQLGKEMYRTTDGGRTWERFKTVAWQGQFSFVDELTGWAVARSGDEVALVQTTDGGRTWLQIQPMMVP